MDSYRPHTALSSFFALSHTHSHSFAAHSLRSFARGVAIDVIVSAAVVSRELVLSACTAEKMFVLK